MQSKSRQVSIELTGGTFSKKHMKHRLLMIRQDNKGMDFCTHISQTGYTKDMTLCENIVLEQ